MHDDEPTHSHHGRHGTPGPLRRATPLLASLDAEWRHLCHRRMIVERIRRWPLLVGDPTRAAALGAATERSRHLDDLLDATQRLDHRRRRTGETDASADLVLGALVEVARHDDLAGRIVVRRITPGVIATAKRWGGIDPGEAIDLAVSSCWIAIAGFDPDRRSGHVAAALVSDVTWAAFRKEARRRSATEVPMGPPAFVDRPDTVVDEHPIVALAHVVRAAASAGVERRHLDLVRELARADSPADVARRHRVTTRTIRNRRDAARRHIVDALGPDWSPSNDDTVAA